jgi:hypothetical protein
MLQIRIAWAPQWPSQWKLAEEGTRRSDPSRLLPDRSERKRGKSQGFKGVRERTDRTRTEGSNGGEQDHVHAIRPQQLCSVRPTVKLHRSHRCILVSGER